MQKLDHKPVLVLVHVKDEELNDVFRRMFKDVRQFGSSHIIANIITESEYWKVFANSREAILDNLDLELEIYTWKNEEVDKLMEKVQTYVLKGIITYCSDENKYSMRKVIEVMPNSLKTLMLKDNCK
ncbi:MULTISPECIES: DUF5751 family protein [Acidianus]|nr:MULTISPECIES: DUF5751 family protein [Acidianus]NON63659.1 hypothetical protein [Acidianus sp. RZ1]